METDAKKPAARKKLRVKKRFVILLAVAALIVTVCVMLANQEIKLRELAYEEAKLTEEYAALQTEEERLQYMIEYAQSRDYLLQYAREVLGMVLPEDTIFNAD